MILFSSSTERAALPGGCFADHLDPGLCFYLPDTLALAHRADGVPDFKLVRYGGEGTAASGGLLFGAFELRRGDLKALRSAAPQTRWEPVDSETATVRLLVRSRTTNQALQEGRWYPATLAANRNLRVAAYLGETDASLLASLLAAGEESVEVEVALLFRGLVPGIPGYARLQSEHFIEQMRLLVAERDLRLDEIVAACLSLPTEGVITYHPLEDSDPARPSHETLMDEVARRSLDRFFHRVESDGDAETPLFRFVAPEAGGPGTEVIVLHTPRIQDAEHRLPWSVSVLYDALTDPESRASHFPVVGHVSPMSEVRIPIANSLPFDPGFLQRVVVDLRYTGPAGTFEHETFRFSDDGEFHELRTRYPSINTSFALESRVRALLVPPGGQGWPIFWPPEAGFVGEKTTSVEITPARAQLRVCHIAVDPRAFDHASRIACVLKDPASGADSGVVATVDLDASRSTVAIVVPDTLGPAVPEIMCAAFPPDGREGGAVTLVPPTPCPRYLTIPVHRLEVLEPDTICARISRLDMPRLVFAAVAFKAPSEPEESDGTLRTFPMGDDEPAIRWKTWRTSVFEQVHYLYRAQFILTDGAGQTLPLQFGRWTAAADHELVIALPVDG